MRVELIKLILLSDIFGCNINFRPCYCDPLLHKPESSEQARVEIKITLSKRLSAIFQSAINHAAVTIGRNHVF